ncbi:MAG: TraR/DksA family transcriptional regulator [Ilumatobacteraceae bacterium]
MTSPSTPDGSVRRELEGVRDEIAGRIDTLRAGAEMPTGGISFGKRVGEGTSIAIERFAEVAVHDQLVQQLAAVEAALARLDDGTYGSCEKCGGAIGAERLEAMPWARHCISCA